MAAELAIIAKLQDEASSGIRALRGEIEGLGDSGGIAAKGFASLQSVGLAAISAIGAAAAAAGVALAGFVAGSISKAADLEAQMDTVAALLGATAEQAELLRQATLDLALDPQLKVSATEAAQAIEMLAQNGLTVEEILGGAARATVLLANATGADFTIAARIATDAMALWGMEADQLGQVADGVTAVLVQSKFEVNDYALALAQAGGVAAAVGVSFDDFNATLVAIAPYFASGSDAGTSYKTMLQRLIPTTNNAKDAMAALGLITENGANAFFDSQGNMRDMAEVAGILHGALSGLSEQQRLQALSTIFGTDAMRAAAAMSQFTEDQFRNLMAVMANTSAAEIAAQRMENFSGAMDILRGVVEGLQLMLGNVLLPILTKLALAGANLLAAWGPPVIGVFQAFIDNLSEGMSVIDAFIEAIWDIAPEPVLNALIAFRDSILPIIQRVGEAITSFISWKDVLVALGIAIASVVVPALFAIVQFAAPIVAVFAGLVLAIAALRNAFESNFLGIRDLALTLWGALQGVFEGIKALLSGDTTTAMAAFRSAWETGWAAVVGFVQNAGSQIGQALAGLWQGIVAWFQGVDWGALGQTLIEKFFAGMAALGQAAAGRWEWLLTSITSFIQSVDWGKLGYTLIDLLIKGIIGAVGLIGTALAGIVTFIWNFIIGTNWIELGISLVGAIIEGLRSFGEGAAAALSDWRQAIFDWAGAEDWSGVGEHIAGMVGEKLGEARDAVTAKLSEWQTAIFDWAGAEDWQGVADFIAEGVGEKLGEAKDAVTAQLSEWQTAIFDWAGAEDWQGVADFIAEGVGEKLGEAKDAVTAQLSEWQTAIFDWAGAEDWQGVADTISEMVGTALGEAADSIAGQLVTWRDAIFEWAGAEDWTGVGQTVAELVGTALADAGQTIYDKLESWEQAIFDWAGAEDWVGVSETIASSVGDSLVDVSDKVTEKLSSWVDAFTEWVNSVDWYQVGYDLMFKITDAFLDFKTAITGKLTSWVNDLKTETEGYAWYEVAAAILLKIATAAMGTVADWVGVVGSWVSNIGSAIQQHLANLAQVGRDIVGGIVAGINAAADLIRGAIAGAAGASVPAAADAVGAQSPAKKLIPVGMDISAGIAVGITQGAGAILDAIHAVADATKVESAKAFGEAMAAVAEGIAAALSAALDVGSFSGVGDGFGAALRQIATVMADMVNAVAEANTHSKEALEELVEFVGLAGDINDLLVQTADVTDYIARWRPPNVSATNAAIQTLVAYLGVMVNSIVGLNMEAMLILGALGEFLDSALKLPELFVGVADVMSFLASWQAPSLAPAIASMNTLASFLRQLVAAVAGANTMGLGMLAILAAFIETVSGIVELIAPLTDAIKMVVAFPGGDDLYIFTRNMEAIATYLAALVTAVASANEWGALSLELLDEFVGVVGEIADLVTPMLEAIKNVVSFPGGGDLYLFVRNVEAIGLYLNALVGAVAESNQWGSLSLALLDEFVQVAGGIAELITPMTEAIKNIVAFQLPDWSSFLFGVATIGTYMALLVGSFSEGLLYSHDALELLGEYVDVVGALAEGMADFVGAIGLVAAFEAPDWTTFLMNVGTIGTYMAYLVGSFSEGLNYSQAALELLGPYIEVVSSLAEGMADFVEAIGLVASFVAPDWTTFLFNVATIGAYMAMLVAAFSEGLSYSLSALEVLGEYVGVVGDLVDLVGDVIEALGLIAAYSGNAAALGPAIQAFSSDLSMLVAALRDAFAQASAETMAAMAAAGEFAGHAEDILDVVEPGIEALTALAGYVSASGAPAAVGAFAADLVMIVQALGAAFAAASVELGAAASQAAEFAGHAEDIVDVVEPGIEALAALADYTSGADLSAKTQQFTGDLIAVTQLLVAGLTQSALSAGDALGQASSMAQSIGKLFDIIKPALEALGELAKYSAAADVQAKAAQFTGDLVAVANTLVTGLNSAATQLGQNAIAAAQAFATGVTGIVNEVKAAMTGLVDLAGIQTPSIEPTLAYIVQSSNQITGAFTAAGDIGAAVQYAAAFRANLEQLVEEVQAAVAQLNALAGSGTGGSVQSALTAIAASLQNTEGQFAGAGSSLAGALIDALDGGISGGQSAVLGALAGVLTAAESSGLSEAREFSDVGDAITDAMADGVSSGQNQVVAAVVQVVSAAVAAGLNEARKAAAIGEEVIRALLSEMNSSRSTLDQAGSSAGAALIDGMVRAIVAGKSRLVNAIKDAVSGAIVAAKAALGIASPSKVAYELMDNFMRTAAGRLGRTDEMAAAVGRSIDAAMATAAARLSGVKLATPVAVNAGLSRSPVVPGVLPRPATAGGAPEGSFRGGSINIYGNIVLPNVSNPVSFLEELDALRGGGR